MGTNDSGNSNSENAAAASSPSPASSDDLYSTAEAAGDFHLAEYDDDEGDFLAASPSEPKAAAPAASPLPAEPAPQSSAPSAPGQQENAPQPTPPAAAQPQIPAAAPEPAPAQKQEATPAAAPAASSAPAEPGELARSMIENREVLAQQLAQELYSNVVPPEELAAAGFDENAGAVISRIAAQVHLNLSALLYQTIANQVPRMMESGVPRILEHQRARTSFWEKFDQTWPTIKRSDPKVDETMRRIVSQYGAAHPQVPVDQAVKEIGGLVALALGIAAQPATPAPAQPAAPRPAAPGNVVGTFQPAQGGVPSLPQPSGAVDPWAGLGGDFED